MAIPKDRYCRECKICGECQVHYHADRPPCGDIAEPHQGGEATRPTPEPQKEQVALELVHLFMELTHKTYWRLGNFKHWLQDRILLAEPESQAPAKEGE